MSNLPQQRNYYKIFSGSNQEEGHDKIYLGYEAQTSELKFAKDSTTSFHVPYFANTQNINNSTLIGSGATPGPIPALADRVFKKQGNYGNTTPWGTSSDQHDGTWLCSWLYASSSGTPIWLDRFYNPGRLAYEEALRGDANYTDYVSSSTSLYYDIPSTLTFEAGVLYQYYHQGEKDATTFVSTFAGVSGNYLNLSIENWSSNTVDASVYNNKILFKTFNPTWVVSDYNPGYLDRSILSFNNKDFIDCSVPYSPSYNNSNEFTLSFWVKNERWTNATSTQLVGNFFNGGGGYGVFYENLLSTPYFVIPESYYGHLYYFNQKFNLYTEKNIEANYNTAFNISFIAINSNYETIVLSTDTNALTSLLIKYDHLGNVITYNDTIIGSPGYLLIDGSDNTIVSTTSGGFIFDKNLNSIQTNNTLTYTTNTKAAYNMKGVLITQTCLDIKFDSNNNKWVIGLDGNLYYNDTLTNVIPNSNATSLAIGPDNNVWILVDSNLIYLVNIETVKLTTIYEIGVQTNTTNNIRNLGFIYSYNRTSNSFTWYAALYHSFEKIFYQVTLDGVIIETTYLPQKLNILDPTTALEDVALLEYKAVGDFTGYERKRIFNAVNYNNKPQLQFKISANQPDIAIPNTTVKLSVPVQYLLDNNWHLITATIKTNTLSLYVDNALRDTIQIPVKYKLDFLHKNTFYIGTPYGKNDNLNYELVTNTEIWNGYFDSLKIYNYAIPAEHIQYFIREKTIATDITWNVPTAALQYIEGIDKFFKHRLPGAKSPFYNLKITGTQITDPNMRSIIESNIKKAVSNIQPAYTRLLNIIWD
jgi:hypothetical protein